MNNKNSNNTDHYVSELQYSMFLFTTASYTNGLFTPLVFLASITKLIIFVPLY